MKNLLVVIASVCALSLAVAMSPSAQAAVITLANNVPGGGYVPENGTVYAYHFTGIGFTQATYVVQGVSFLPFSTFVNPQFVGNVRLDNGAPYFSGPSTLTGTGNDLALNNMSTVFVYGGANSGASAMKLTLGGLVVGKTYQLDLFLCTSYTNTATYTITDANGSIVESVPGTSGTYYDVRDTVVAADDGGGIGRVIVVVTNIIGEGATDVPYMTAFSLTEHVPEPVGAMTLGFGGAMLTMRRGARRAA